MPLAPGTRFGSYEVTELIGVGGMGEVYKARDVRLERDVAVKVIAEAGRLDPGAVARINREALLLASLNHPNIATLHGLETAGDTQVLVMELVDGETLEERVASAPRGGGLALDDALNIAEQIAAALDAAHQRGIVHRDLKPANVKIRKDGTVKVLDFGIAKVVSADGSGDLSKTVTTRGTVIGTPSYMSPEQAAGGAVDQKSDIWAFGCLLYEMLTGQRTFDGDSGSRILARVIEREPDWRLLGWRVPERIRRLLAQCLEKDPRKRRRDAGDIRLEIEQARTEPRPESGAKRGSSAQFVRIAGAAVLGVLVTLFAAGLFEEPTEEFNSFVPTPASRYPHHFAVSPDGRYIVYVASVSPPGTVQGLFLWDFRSREETRIPNTEGAKYPFWSPDSTSIGYFDSENLYRIDTAGGERRRLAPAQNGLGASWGKDDWILYTSSSVVPLFKVQASGGPYTAATSLDFPTETNHRFPSFLPDGDHYLYFVAGSGDVAGVYLGSLEDGSARRLTPSASAGVFLAPDWVVFEQSGALVARRLDLRHGELEEGRTALTGSLHALANGYLPFSASADGAVLAYRDMPEPRATMTWFDKDGNGLAIETFQNGPELSSGDRYLAYDATVNSNRDVYIRDLEREGEGGTPLTYDTTVDGYPVWSDDDKLLVFERQRENDQVFELWIGRFNRPGQERRLLSMSDNLIPFDWSGGYLLVRRSDADFLSSDLLAVPLTVEDGMAIAMGEGQALNPDDAIPVASSPLEERSGEFSPDGNWVAYDKYDLTSGRSQVFVRSFPNLAEEIPVTTNDGTAPRWSSDGSEIYYFASNGMLMSSRFTVADEKPSAETPVPKFQTEITAQAYNHEYAVMADGQFLVNSLEVVKSPAPIAVVVHWRR